MVDFILLGSVVALSAAVLFFLASSIRYGSSSSEWDFRSLAVLYPIARLSGQKKILFINKESDAELCVAVLKSSTVKGKGIENWFAMPAWNPIYNIESVDGDVWKSTKQYFHRIAATISLEEVEKAASDAVEKLISLVRSDKTRIVDAKEFSLFAAKIYHKVLFGFELSEADADLFYEASLQWRKHVALKGHGNFEMKMQMVRRVAKLISESKKYSEDIVAKASRYDPELMTAFMQPFFISPMINFSDIFVAVFNFARKNEHVRQALQAATSSETTYSEGFSTIESVLLESIRLQHPFPILERELTREVELKGQVYPVGTQVFIEFDKFKQDTKFDHERWMGERGKSNVYSFMPFGVGPRQCLGRHIAIKSLVPILYCLMKEQDLFDRIQPTAGHKYSGRNNDNSEDFAESVYVLKTLSKTLLRVLYYSLTRAVESKHPI